MKYLGLDVGQRKIGVAVGEVLATELLTLRCNQHESFYANPARSRAYDEIETIMNEEGAAGIVVGLPVKEDGTASEESAKIADFCDGLSTALDVTVHTVDETLTSFMARDILESQGIIGAELENRLDQASAALILQQYLEEHATI